MKSLDSPTLAHLAGEELTLSTCWKIEAEGAAAVGFTDHDTDLTVSGLVYSSLSGYAPTNIQSTSSLSVDNLDIQGLLSALGVTDADIQAGIYDHAQVWIFQTNWADTTQIIKLKYGLLGEVRTAEAFLAEFRSLSQLLSQTIGSIITPDCRAELGDSECGINLYEIAATGAHKYWRLVITDPATLRCAEIEMAGSVGGADLCNGGTPSASSYVFSDFPSHAFDNNTSTAWRTFTVPAWIKYEFASPEAIIELRVKSDGFPSQAPNDIEIQYSDNDIDWVTTYAYTGIGWSSWSTNTYVAGILLIPGYDSTGSVVAVTDRSNFTDTTRTEADDYYKYGLLTWTSGNNNGYAMEVKGYTLSTGAFELFEPMPYDVEIGDTYMIYAGCDKFDATCKAKFNNLDNIRAYPNCPTQDQISKFGGQ